MCPDPSLTKIYYSVNLELNSEDLILCLGSTWSQCLCSCASVCIICLPAVLGLVFSHLAQKEILKMKLVGLSWRSTSTFKVVLFSLTSKGNFSLSNNSVTQVSRASISHEQLVIKGIWAEVGKAGGKTVVWSSIYAHLGVMISWTVLIYWL